MKKNLLICLSILIVGAVSCGKVHTFVDEGNIDESAPVDEEEVVTPPEQTPVGEPIVLTETEQIISASINDFAFRSFSAILSDEALSGKAFMYSPLSLSLALSLLETGAEGETAEEIRDFLGFQEFTDEDLCGYSKKLTDGLIAVDPNTTFNSANAVWGDLPVVFKEDFIERTNEYYGALVKNVDMNTEDAVNEINSWCDEKTNGLIKQIASWPWQGDPPLIMLANALYFKAMWPDGYHPEVEKGVFHSTGGDETEDFLLFSNSLPYLKTSSCSMVSIPYGNGSYNILLALPDEGATMEDAVKSFGEIEGNWISHLEQYSRGVQCSFPKFKIDQCSFPLEETLMGMGLSRLFDPKKAELGGFSNLDNLFVSKIMQDTYIDVNEKGTEAAAITHTYVIGTDISSKPEEPVIIKLDRPFAFMIYEKGSGAILFIGQKL